MIKWGRHGSFIACTGYPECTNTREIAEGGRDRAGRGGILRQLRPSHGAEEGPLRAVPGVLRLSRLQDHQATGRGAEAEGCAARRKLPAVRRQTGQEVRALRRVRGVQQLSQVQIRQAEDHRREVPQLFRGRSRRAALQARQDLLRLQPLSGLRFRGVGQAHRREVSGVRRQLPDREVPEVGRVRAMPQRRVQVQEAA